MHKAGYVCIVGLPNAGKSTLLNQLIGEKLSIVTHKPQTTRKSVIGIYNDQNHQIVFMDTPGVISSKYKLQAKMMQYVKDSITDADIFLLLIDGKYQIKEAASFQETMNSLNVPEILKRNKPVFVLINKIDELAQDEVERIIEGFRVALSKANVVAISALHNFNLDVLVEKIKHILPEHPPFYNKEDMSAQNLRFIASEFIREQVFLLCRKEIPYATEIQIDTYKEEENLHRILATLYVEKESQKPIILGKSGSQLKKIATAARLALENFIHKKVYLNISVKVRKKWRGHDGILERFGY